MYFDSMGPCFLLSFVSNLFLEMTDKGREHFQLLTNVVQTNHKCFVYELQKYNILLILHYFKKKAHLELHFLLVKESLLYYCKNIIFDSSHR